ncbi:MAG: hypothetical protein KDK30_06535 [Leptospiraceae bacterium]|nr:hypothetical protein [Leptospiraceae bacterium]
MKLRTLTFGLILIAVSLSAGCKSGPPVMPAAENSTLLAIQLELAPPLSLFGNKEPEKVFFVRVLDDNLMSRHGMIESTWARDNRVYLLNAEPGVYIAVAGQYSITTEGQTTSTTSGNVTVSTTTGGGTNYYTTFFPEEVVQNTRIVVEPNKVTFMGKYVLGMEQGYDSMDEMQKHYVEQMFPGAIQAAANRSAAMGFLTAQPHYRGVVKSQILPADGMAQFTSLARGDFGETPWSAFFN